MARLAFLLHDDRYHKAGVKPYVDLALGLRRLESDPYLFSIVSSNELKEDIGYRFPELNVHIFENMEGLLSMLRKLKPDLIISTDYPKLMKILTQIKEELKIRVGVYAQLLFGTNTLGLRSKSNIKFKIGSLVPWGLLIHNYSKMMGKMDVVIANSYAMQYVLTHFYEVKVNGVVYPPVGINLRPLADKWLKERTDRGGILIYTGHYPDYYIRDINKTISELASHFKVKCFGGQVPKAECHAFVPDNELAKLYVSSIATYVAPAWETFGYVGPESLLFGTPVLMDTYQPWLEGFPIETGAVKISDPRENIIEALEELLNVPKDMDRARKYVMEQYSVERSANELLKIVRRME